ncbi:MAG: hypothetical protein QM831_38090 [Kofleriaceae bacterium]
MTWLASVFVTVLLFACGGCIDAPLEDEGPQAKIVAEWDPLMCGDPHRVAVELEDSEGVPLSASTTCALGTLSLDARHFGVYRGRIYAWELGIGERSTADIHLTVDQAIVHWYVPTPQ